MYGTSSHTPLPAPVARTGANSSMPKTSRLCTSIFLLALALADCDDDQYEGCDANDDDQQVAVAEIPRGDVFLHCPGLRRQASRVFIAQLAHCLVHLREVGARGFQRFLTLFRGKQLANGSIVRLAVRGS